MSDQLAKAIERLAAAIEKMAPREPMYLPGQLPMPPYQYQYPLTNTYGQTPKCACPPGTVCGSVACPHLPKVTC